MQEKVLGIVGGMGPAATVDLMAKIIACTNAKEENDYIHMLVDCNPKLPNRQTAILEGTESPLPALIAMAQGLEKAGADFLILGANTPYYYYNEIVSEINIPMLHIPDETIAFIKNHNPEQKSIGILAANAPIKTNLFQDACRKAGIVPLVLPAEQQQVFHDAIFTFKVDNNKEAFRKVIVESIETLKGNGAKTVILGCTELPIVLSSSYQEVQLVDPNEIIAHRILAYAKNE